MEELLMINRQDIVSIADAIRSKTNTADEMTISEMVANIAGINNSGSAKFTTGVFSHTVIENYEPELDLYILTSNDLKASNRNIIIVKADTSTEAGNDSNDILYVAYRLSKEDDFLYAPTHIASVSPRSLGFSISENCINCCIEFDEYQAIERFDFVAI